jgi:hypothetical protein
MRAHATGDRVTQSKYGAGTVTEANAHHTVIDFDEHGLRRFVTDIVRLEPSATPAPQRASTRAKRAAKPKTT